MRRVLLIAVVLILFSILGFAIGGFNFRAQVTSDIIETRITEEDPGFVNLKVNYVEQSRCLVDCNIAAAQNGNIIFIVDFTVENHFTDDYLFNPLHTKLRDAQGYAYQRSFFSTELPRYFSVTTIGPGKLARGQLGYEVPATSEVLYFELDSVLGKRIAQLDLSNV